MKAVKKKLQQHVQHCLKNPSRDDTTDQCIFCNENTLPENILMRMQKIKEHHSICIMNPKRNITKAVKNKNQKATRKTKQSHPKNKPFPPK